MDGKRKRKRWPAKIWTKTNPPPDLRHAPTANAATPSSASSFPSLPSISSSLSSSSADATIPPTFIITSDDICFVKIQTLVVSRPPCLSAKEGEGGGDNTKGTKRAGWV